MRNVIGLGVIEDGIHLVQQDGNGGRFRNMDRPWTFGSLRSTKALSFWRRVQIGHFEAVQCMEGEVEGEFA